MGEPTLTPEEREAIKRRADVVRPLLRSISAWPWTSVKVEEEGFPCIPHPHFDFYVEAAELEVIEGRPGYLHAKADWDAPACCVNVGCYLGKEADADFIVSAPEMIRMLRDDVWSLLAALTAAERRAEAAERDRDAAKQESFERGYVVGFDRAGVMVRREALEEAAKIAGAMSESPGDMPATIADCIRWVASSVAPTPPETRNA